MSARFLDPKPHRYWVSVGVFPAALQKRDTHDEQAAQAQRALVQLGLGNLRYLFEARGWPHSLDDRQAQLASAICAADTETVFFLREFHRPRIAAIEEIYEARLTSKERKRVDAAVSHLSLSDEKPRSLTKLLLLYAKDAHLLQEIFLLSLWRSRPTSFEYQVTGAWPPGLLKRLLGAARNSKPPCQKCWEKGGSAIKRQNF